MDYKDFASAVVIATVSSLAAQSVMAQDISFQPRATLGYEYYELDGENDGTSNQLGDFNFKSDYLVGGLGLTIQSGRFFADFYGQKNLSRADNLDRDAIQDEVDFDQEADRYNVNLALGYAITPSISVIGGLKYSRTDIESDIVSDDEALDILLAGSFFNVDVEYIGPYLGGAYAIPIGTAGHVILNGSVSYLFGETTVDAEVDDVVIADNETIDGESIGANLGVAWSGGFGQQASAPSRFGYTIGVDYSTYQFADGDVDEFKEETVRGKLDFKVRF